MWKSKSKWKLFIIVFYLLLLIIAYVLVFETTIFFMHFFSGKKELGVHTFSNFREHSFKRIECMLSMLEYIKTVDCNDIKMDTFLLCGIQQIN